MKNASKIWIGDCESYPNLFLVCFNSARSEDRREFYLFEDQLLEECHAQITGLRRFIKNEVSELVSYNGIWYDTPMLHLLLSGSHKECLSIGTRWPAILNAKSNELISIDNPLDKYKQQIVKPFYQDRDLFRINHFNNPSRSTSLKDLEVRLRLPVIKDLPFKPGTRITADQIDTIIEYCHLDVEVTKIFYERCEDIIKLRDELTESTGIDLRNADDPKIGSQILLQRMSKKMSINSSILVKRRTYRVSIHLSDIIFDTLKFDSKVFNDVLDRFKAIHIYAKEGKPELKSFTAGYALFDGMRYDFGLGGLHASRPQSIWKAENDMMITTMDFSSYYPHLAFKYGFRPEHLGEAFSEVYEEIYHERKKHAKGTSENYALKIALVSSFGKMNDEYSWLYDPQALLSITVNGQLVLALLAEKMSKYGQVLMVNTDGLELYHHKSKHDDVLAIAAKFSSWCKIPLELGSYKGLFIRDVNGYIAQSTDGSIKTKGPYEIDKPLWKDSSMRAIRIATAAYFIDNIQPKRSFEDITDIHDYALMQRAPRTACFYLDYEDGTSKTLSRTVRYIPVSKKTLVGGDIGWLRKHFDEGKNTKYHAGQKVQILNEIDSILVNDYPIDYGYYLRETALLVRAIETNQLKLI